ncbi:DnaJ-domain-containing protein [Neocallimastix californiae]|jgi:curved DNA-binding protein CbpA|uniref:DnaJ-domain-containing protein n=1 Tax=Neocallimastix californiae TaxID=1754190 RepID=A0A1Y2AFA4_9FUNG|nr:DnaJ-domain-containing protein [Neocallimastix californiae]|eukprot:ORY21269.1 DnaJ-domain-containing protein [Neocallimastix californiae]
MTTKKYYEILGISETATDSEIKKAYRKEALRWHPDKNQDRLEEANERFKLISEAYEVLKDPEQRAIYNKYGDEGFKQRASGGAGYGSGNMHEFHFSNPEDIFREFFGGQDPFSAFFGGDPFGGNTSRRGSNSRRNDPFGGFSMFGNSFFDDDDFFGGSGHQGFSSFSSSSFGGPGSSTFTSFSSSSIGGGNNGNFVSTSQRTEIINGKKTIVKETRDGNGNTTVERTTIEPDGRRTQETIVNGKQQSYITDNEGHSGERLRLEDQQHSKQSSHHSSRRSSTTNNNGTTNTKSTTTTSPETKHKKKFGFGHFF